jgi:hypothetical protein
MIVRNIDNLVIDGRSNNQAQYMVATLYVTGQTNQKSFKGIFKSVKIRTS